MSYFDLQGHVALITGASSGFGAHFAKTLAAHGCTVGIAARRADRLDTLAEEIEKAGGVAVVLSIDVTDQDAVAKGMAELAKKAGGVADILVNNAGMSGRFSFLEATDDETDRVFAVNQNAVWDITRQFSRTLVDAGKSGSVINISSITGLRAIKGAASYAVSKAAIAHMTKVHALELARYGIRVNAIAPGYFLTELTHDFLRTQSGEKLIKRIPMQRTGRLDELDGLLLLLASDRGSFMTGAVIPVDGGHLVSSL